jgi:hypothetical protein
VQVARAFGSRHAPLRAAQAAATTVGLAFVVRRAAGGRRSAGPSPLNSARRRAAIELPSKTTAFPWMVARALARSLL